MSNIQRQQRKTLYTAKQIATTALFAATLTGGKLALSFIPNVEIVTILIAVYATVWGWKYTLPAVNVFVVVETLIYGFNTWVISYFIHWNCLAVVFLLLRPLLTRCPLWLKIIVATVSAAVITTLFGVLTSLIDTLLGYTSQGFVVATKDFWYRFGVLYARGAVFFAIHIVSNTILFATAYYPLCKVLTKLRNTDQATATDIADTVTAQSEDIAEQEENADHNSQGK